MSGWVCFQPKKVLIDLAEQGQKHLIVVPISFVGDHVETMHEINIEYREVAEEKGITNFVMTRAPKANPLLTKALAEIFGKETSFTVTSFQQVLPS